MPFSVFRTLVVSIPVISIFCLGWHLFLGHCHIFIGENSALVLLHADVSWCAVPMPSARMFRAIQMLLITL